MNITQPTAEHLNIMAAMPAHINGWMKWIGVTRSGRAMQFYAPSHAEAIRYATDVINRSALKKSQEVVALTNRMGA